MLCSFKLAAFILKIPLKLCTGVFNNFMVKEYMNVMIHMLIRTISCSMLERIAYQLSKEGRDLTINGKFKLLKLILQFNNKIMKASRKFHLWICLRVQVVHIYFFVMLIWLSRRISIITSKLFALKKWRHNIPAIRRYISLWNLKLSW